MRSKTSVHDTFIAVFLSVEIDNKDEHGSDNV